MAYCFLAGGKGGGGEDNLFVLRHCPQFSNLHILTIIYLLPSKAVRKTVCFISQTHQDRSHCPVPID